METQAFTHAAQTPINQAEPLPFPFNQRTYCRYEPIEKRIETCRVLIVDDLLRDERDISEVARREWGRHTAARLKRERKIAPLAVSNIRNNVERLVRVPHTREVHLSEVAEAVAEYRPDAVVLSGTLSDFDYYNPELLENFARFVRATQTPVLGICGGHQLVGISFGSRVETLGHKEQHEQREGRPFEYQYRLVRIMDRVDPIFEGIDDRDSHVWQDYTVERSILRVWQNHGLQINLPEGFTAIANSYFCRNQMMVRRAEGQLIYAVQFHLEKSFEDWDRRQATRWEHPNDSRDGRVIFEHFLRLALEHQSGGERAGGEAA